MNAKLGAFCANTYEYRKATVVKVGKTQLRKRNDYCWSVFSYAHHLFASLVKHMTDNRL